MKALILAAGIGKRLGLQGEEMPKCLIEIDGKSLLRRHIEMLAKSGINKTVIAVGYQRQLIETEISRIETMMSVSTVYNPAFHQGSILTLSKLLTQDDMSTDILLMDADVLYDHRLIAQLLTSKHQNCFLLDRDFEPGEEPVKLCIRAGELVEFRKKIAVTYDFCGESVGFFRFSPKVINCLHQVAKDYIDQGHVDSPYEEAIRDVLLANPEQFGFEDITGLPWIEVDFPEDVERAKTVIYPRLK